jgi:hypothetical protein
VVTGLPVEGVLQAFGADPDHPESIATQWAEATIDPWVSVLRIRGAVLAVEFNGWQASNVPTSRYASAGGRAASMYWNVNAVTRLSFASDGQEARLALGANADRWLADVPGWNDQRLA